MKIPQNISQEQWKKWRPVAMSVVALVLLSYGVIAQKKSWWPSHYFENAIEYFDAIRIKKNIIRSVKSQPELKNSLNSTMLLSKARIDIIDSAKMSPGLTLICLGSDSAALIDKFGQLRHLWTIPFSEIWKQPPHISSPVPDILTFMHDAEVYPNGDLLALFHGEGDTPYGYGLVKLDKNSKVIWKLALNAHHDVYISHSGDIYTLSQQYEKNDIPQLEDFYRDPYLKEYVEIISPNGEEKERISIPEAFIGTPYEQMLFKALRPSHDKLGDYTHANSVMPLEADMADKFPMFKPGQILVSLRNMSVLAVIDPDTQKVVWAQQGIWSFQHEASFQPDGNILLLDNQGFYNGSGPQNEVGDDGITTDKSSRILELNPATGGISWAYTATPEESFYTLFRGTVQKLPNGNYLIVETSPGRKIMEVTQDKKVVWRFTNNKKKEKNYTNKVVIGSIFKAARIPLEYFDKEFQDSL